MNRALALLMALGCMTAVSAQAQEDEESKYGRNGWYVGLYGVLGQSAYRDKGGDWGISGGLSGRVGYRASALFAIEGDVEWIYQFENDDVTSRTIDGSINGKIFLSDGRVQPYGLVGAGALNVTREGDFGSKGRTDWGFRFGAGIDLYTTENVVIGLEARYNWGVGDVWELDYASYGLGVLYRF